MRLEGEGYQGQAIREFNESAEVKGHDRVPDFADVDDWEELNQDTTLATCAGCGLYGPLGKTHFRGDSGEECGEYV